MPQEYLMNIASSLFFICYIPEFYANIRNKNANMYNVFEKVVMLAGTGFGLGYSLTTNSPALVFNYSILFGFDTVALAMRSYYAYKNKNRDVRMLSDADTHNPIQGYIEDYTHKYRQESKEYPDKIIDPL